MRPCSFLICLVLALFSPHTLFAQSNATDGALDGFVRDPSAASVPAATVIATNLRTGLVTTATTSTEGYYRFPLLQVGEYEVLVSAPGFADYRQTGIRLSAGTTDNTVESNTAEDNAGTDIFDDNRTSLSDESDGQSSGRDCLLSSFPKPPPAPPTHTGTWVPSSPKTRTTPSIGIGAFGHEGDNIACFIDRPCHYICLRPYPGYLWQLPNRS